MQDIVFYKATNFQEFSIFRSPDFYQQKTPLTFFISLAPMSTKSVAKTTQIAAILNFLNHPSLDTYIPFFRIT
jgi:hypothetical protein